MHAYVNDALDRSKDCGNRCADEWDRAQQASLANEDVEKDLMNPYELPKRVCDGLYICGGSDLGSTLHQGDVLRDSIHDIGEP